MRFSTVGHSAGWQCWWRLLCALVTSLAWLFNGHDLRDRRSAPGLALPAPRKARPKASEACPPSAVGRLGAAEFSSTGHCLGVPSPGTCAGRRLGHGLAELLYHPGRDNLGSRRSSVRKRDVWRSRRVESVYNSLPSDKRVSAEQTKQTITCQQHRPHKKRHLHAMYSQQKQRRGCFAPCKTPSREHLPSPWTLRTR